jgi:hypothetical protein
VYGYVVRHLVRLEETATTVPHDVLVVEARRILRDIEEDLVVLGIDGPPTLHGSALIEPLRQWSAAVLGDLASGRWPQAGVDRSRRTMRLAPGPHSTAETPAK